MRGWNVLRLPPEMVKLLTFVLIIGGVHSVGGASSRFSLMFFRGAFVQVDPSQERVAQRILGGFCAGDGDPGGKSGRKKPAGLVGSSRSHQMVSTFFDARFHRFTLSGRF